MSKQKTNEEDPKPDPYVTAHAFRSGEILWPKDLTWSQANQVCRELLVSRMRHAKLIKTARALADIQQPHSCGKCCACKLRAALADLDGAS